MDLVNNTTAPLAVASACAWCGFHGDAQHTGVSSVGVAGSKASVEWTAHANGTINGGAALAADGSVYVGSQLRRKMKLPFDGAGLLALDGHDGSGKWFFATNDSVSVTPAINPADGTVYFACDNTGLGTGNESVVFAVDGATGAEKWRFDMECARPFVVSDDSHLCLPSSPTVDAAGATLYIGSGDDKWFALDAASGALKWHFKSTGEAPGTDKPAWNKNGAALSADGGTVYVGEGTFTSDKNHTLWALDGQTGAVLWQFHSEHGPTAGRIFASPMVAHQRVYVGLSDATIYALDEKTGATDWTYATANFEHLAPTLSADGAAVYVGETEGIDDRVWALDAASGTELWHFGGEQTYAPLATLADGAVLVITGAGDLVALDHATGKKIWKADIGDALAAPTAAIAADGKIIVTTEGENLGRPGRVIAYKTA